MTRECSDQDARMWRLSGPSLFCDIKSLTDITYQCILLIKHFIKHFIMPPISNKLKGRIVFESFVRLSHLPYGQESLATGS